ncbi:Uncharacterised protein [Bordetella pertussis]|nr:Uncharacterised protein [Bordetella pertussis]CFO64007.1 Uncharacterised protein [Bordetella pertussis]CFW36951.1 Uncharacterised protein [Bordetella pertussis]
MRVSEQSEARFVLVVGDFWAGLLVAPILTSASRKLSVAKWA